MKIRHVFSTVDLAAAEAAGVHCHAGLPEHDLSLETSPHAGAPVGRCRAIATFIAEDRHAD